MSKKLTHKELLRQLDYNPNTGIFIWKVNKKGHNFKGLPADNMDKYGYIRIGINRKNYKAHRLAWFYVYGYFPENDIDHKDQIKYHNWISNLREASRQCNMRNTGNRKDNTSGIKGINFNKKRNKWTGLIKINGQRKSIGEYIDFDEAVCARLAFEQCIGWNNCDSNSSAYQYVKEHIIATA